MLTLTTDFGTKAPYVAEMKGSIYQINPNIDIVDVTHEVSRHNIFEASFVMNEVKKWFPTSVHVCVVDPGVGSGRNALIVKDGEQYFVGPDNGVFSLFDPDKIYEVNEKDLKKILGREISHTFHGRDVFAPVGALYSCQCPSNILNLTSLQLDANNIHVDHRCIAVNRGSESDKGGLVVIDFPAA